MAEEQQHIIQSGEDELQPQAALSQGNILYEMPYQEYNLVK